MAQILKPSAMDENHIQVIRGNVNAFMSSAAKKYASDPKQQKLLDIAPQRHEGARPYFPPWVAVDTLDIDPQSGCTFVADICRKNEDVIPENSYDFVVCTEVLEHTLQPFCAAQEVLRILKPQGKLFLSVPFNFRIHGPLPDCWRFTEHGLRAVLRDFQILELEAVETVGRPLMPVHYTVVAQKNV